MIDLTNEELSYSSESISVIGNSPYTFPTLINTNNLELTFNSSNTEVATINSSGEVTILKNGNAIISATFAGNEEYNEKTIRYTLIVDVKKYLDYIGLCEYHKNIAGKIYIPTIDFIPDETTLTYTKDGKTFDFEIGDFVRVTDETTDVGFKFYQLFDITEQGEAVWGAYSSKTTPTYVAPTAKDLTYNGESQELLNAGSSSDGVIQYSLYIPNRRSITDTLSWSTDIPEATNAGNYIVYWRLVGDGSHSDVLPTAITIEIEKVTPSVISVPTANTLTYNEESQELITPGTTNFGTFQYGFDGNTWSTEIPERTNAGTYTVYYRVLGDDNINTTEASTLEVTISPKVVSNPTIELSPNSFTYNGEECEPTPTLYDGQTIIPSNEYTVSYSDNINAGTATVTITDNQEGNYTVSGSTTFTINKAAGRVDILPVDNSVTYNAAPQVLATAGSGTGIMYYSLEQSDNFSTTVPSLTNAGTYTLYFYAAESANYLQSTPTQSISVTINKANPSYTAPQGKDNLIYSGEAQELLIEGSSPDGIIKYSDDEGETWTTDIPEGTNAITYYPQWKVFGDSNHNDSTPTIITVSIAKVTPTVTAPTIVSNLEYTGEAQNLLNNDGSTNFGTLQYSNDNETFSTTIPTGTNAGSYDIWYRVQGDSNINDVPSVKLTNSIAKVDACYVAPTAITGLVYDKNSHTLLNTGSSTCGTIQYSSDEVNWSSDIPTGIDAGDYTSYWKVIGDSNHIDKPSASIITNIDKAPGEIYVDPTSITGLIYNNTAQSLIVQGSGTGTMQYKVDSGSWESSIPTMINAGTYTIYYKTAENTNYYATDGTNYITNSIAKVTPTVVAPTPRVLTYNTSSQALVNAGSTDWGTLQYSLDESTWSTNIPEAINYGSYTVYYKVVGNSNINDVASDSVACSIAEKRVSTPTIELDPTGYTYSGNQCKPSVIVKDGSHVVPASEYTVTYSNNVNAGTATVTISDNTAGNYNITGTKDFTISKAPGEVTTKPTAKSLTYTGDSQALINAGSGTGTIYYRLGTSGNFSTTIPSATDAGTYTVYFYVAESNNYLQSTPTESVNITIAQKEVTLSWGTRSWTYDKSAHSTTCTVGSLVSGTSCTVTLTGNSITNVGSTTVTASSLSNSNYKLPSANTTTISIVARTVTLSWGTTSWTYDGSTHSTTCTAGNLCSGDTCTVTLSGNSVGPDSNTVSGEMPTVTATGLSNSNYALPSSRTTTLIINSRSITYTATNESWTYDGSSHSASNTATLTSGSLVSGHTATFSCSGSVGPNVGSSTKTLNVTIKSGNTDVSGNYSMARVWGTLSITKANQSAPTATVTAATYPGTSTASASGGGGQGTLTWTNGSTRTAIGTQDTYAYWAGNSNYNASSYSNKVTLSVAKYTPTVTLAATNRAYNGNALYATASIATPSGGKTMKGIIYYGTSSGARTYNVTYSGSGSVNLSSVSVTNVGSATVYAYFTPDTSCNDVYNNSGNASKTFSVSKANQSAPTATGATTTYPTTATASASGGGGQGSIEWSNGNTQTSVGSKTTKARWSGNGNYNASDWSNEVTVKMNKANQTISFNGSTASVLVNHTLTKTATISVGDGAITYSSSDTSKATVNSSTGVVTGVAAGTCTITATAAATTNYNSASASYTLTVQAATSTITIKNPNTVYAITIVYKAYYRGGYHETSNIYVGPSSSAKITLNDNNITWILYFSDAYTINNSSGARTSASVTSSISSIDDTTINATVSRTKITLNKA